MPRLRFPVTGCLDGVFERILTLTKPENILTTLEQEAVDIILLDMNFSLGINNGAGAKTVEICYNSLPLREGRGGSLRISKDGTPIPAEVRRDIFIPFYTTKSTGTGIGLGLSRQIVTMLAGSLELSEKADAGYHTTFILKLELSMGNF